MPICAEIDTGFAFDCDYPAINGVKDRAIAINYSKKELATITRDGTNPNLITAFTLAGTDIGYVFEGQNNSHQPSAKSNAKAYGTNYDHIFKFSVFNSSPAIKVTAEKCMKGRFCVVVENYQQNSTGNGAFEIFGLDVGLVGRELIYDKNNDQNAGFEITLGSPEKIKEPHLPASLFVTSYAASKTIFDNLLVP